MLHERQADSARRGARVTTAMSTAAAAGQEISTSSIARAADAGRTFLYRHRDLLEQIHPGPGTAHHPDRSRCEQRFPASRPAQRPAGGRPRKKGARLGTPAQIANSARWQSVTVHCYGTTTTLQATTADALWYGSFTDAPGRVVLVKRARLGQAL